MVTFAELGIDFPLFGADVEEAAGWQATGRCVLCFEELAGFRIGIGDYVETRCGGCGRLTPVPADDGVDECVHCHEPVVLGDDLLESHGCWSCLRAGRWAATMDTEAGMVTPVHALRGRTHGRLSPSTLADAEPTLAGWPVTGADASGWRRAIVPTPVLIELVRTPNYVTWQGEQWLFHCRRPMRYLGLWGKVDFTAAAPDDDGSAHALRTADLPEDVWEHLSERPGESSILTYMFECPTCGAHRGHWDVD